MPADPKRVKDLFGAAIEIPDAAERQAFVERECAGDAELRQQLERLLAAHQSPHPALEPLGEAVNRTDMHVPDARDLPLGSTFAGRFKVREKLGEGGMGTVYVADQTEPVARRVALKVIRADVSSAKLLARFEQERQALALMDHPNIAKVLDAGVTGGTPYFVMELIKGVPITRYCDEAKLTPRQRLELFIPVCQAVQHAHQKGIIHRDLKPSNILIGLYDGKAVPKVIDFGVAKATGPKLTEHSVYTEVGQIVGTLEYMSPEQAELNNLDIDTRTDVYALGVVLYELLTGTVPFSRQQLQSAGLAEMLRIIKEVEPPRPSTRLSGSGSLPSIAANRQTEPARLTRLFQGELDWMVMKALEKDRGRRYETANGFALDIQRYLADEPVLAGPPGAAYRLRKFVKRNRPQVLAAALVLLALLGGVAGTTWGLLRAQTARDAEAFQRAEAETQRDRAVEAQKLATEQKRRAEAGEKEAKQQRLRAEQEKRIAQAVRDFLQTRLLGQADTRTQADTLLARGGFAAAAAKDITVRELLDRAAAELTAEKIEESFPRQPLLQAEILNTVGSTYCGVGEPAAAVALLQRSAALYRQHQGADHLNTLATLNNLAWAYRTAGKVSEAIRLFQRVKEAIKKKLGADHASTLATLNNLALAYQDAGKVHEAIRLFQQVKEAAEKKLGADHLDTLTTLNNLALAYKDAGKLPEAIRLLEQVKQALQRKLGADHPSTLTTLHNLGVAYQAAGKLPEAIRFFEQVNQAKEKKEGSDHPDTLTTLNNLAAAYRAAGKVTEAIRLFEQVKEAKVKKLGADHPSTLTTINNLALAYQEAGKVAEAIRLLVQVKEAQQKKLGADHPSTLNTLNSLASAYRAIGRVAEAIRLFEQIREAQQKKLGADHPSTLNTLNNLALAYKATGKLPEAIKLYEQVKAAQVAKLGADHPSTLNTLYNLASAYQANGRVAEAIRLFEQIREAQQKKLGADHPSTLNTVNSLAAVYWSAKQLDRSIPLFEDVLKRRQAKLGKDHPDTLLTLANLGVNYNDAGRLDEALPLLEEAYHKGKRHPSLTWVAGVLLSAYVKAGKSSEATRLLRESPPDSPQLATRLAVTGRQLLRLKQYAEAETLLRECLTIREKLAEKKQAQPWQVAYVQWLLGESLLGQKKYKEAEPLLLAGYQGMKKDEKAIPPQGRDILSQALQSLVDLYEALGKKDEAARFRKLLEAAKPAASP
jgi:serine/threonine protein kinase/DNA-binding SARP family transcriptional activator